MFDIIVVRIKIANALELTSGEDQDFNKGWFLNEKGCTVAKPLSQLQSTVTVALQLWGGCGRGLLPPARSVEAGAIRIFCDKIL